MRIVVLLAAVVVSGCALAPTPPEPPEPPLECAEVSRYSEEGTASWYGDSHHGKTTANGERFDMHAMTAAHRRLPMGTEVKVTNLRNSREATLRINDRGPYARGRILDVSRKGAEQLGFTDAGIARVRIETLNAC